MFVHFTKTIEQVKLNPLPRDTMNEIKALKWKTTKIKEKEGKE